MSMSTSLRSVRGRQQFLSGMFAVLSVIGQNAECAETAHRAATAAEVQEVNSRVAPLFANQDDFPDAPVAAVKSEKKLYWASAKADAPLLAPLTVRFRGVTNAYCRLVTLDAQSRELTLVRLPAQANFDDCRGIDQIRYVDVNGDGLLDVIETVKVNSNVQAGQVATALVYVSSAQRPGGYCYADAASRQLTPADLKSDATVAAALAKATQRLGAQTLECTP